MQAPHNYIEDGIPLVGLGWCGTVKHKIYSFMTNALSTEGLTAKITRKIL
jgi:hypothetical protein